MTKHIDEQLMDQIGQEIPLVQIPVLDWDRYRKGNNYSSYWDSVPVGKLFIISNFTWTMPAKDLFLPILREPIFHPDCRGANNHVYEPNENIGCGFLVFENKCRLDEDRILVDYQGIK